LTADLSHDVLHRDLGLVPTGVTSFDDTSIGHLPSETKRISGRR
jgi:hypothetical protein